MPILTRQDALEQLATLTDRLASNRVQLADLEARAHRIRVESWMAAESDYVSARDRVADFNSLDLSCDIITLKGEIAADSDQIAWMRTVLEWGDDE